MIFLKSMLSARHPGENRDPGSKPYWIPVFTGMSGIFVAFFLLYPQYL